MTTDKTDGLGNASNTTGPGGATATSNTTGPGTATNASNMGSVGTPENPSIVLATTILTSLVCEGVRWVAYCPGSRDAPFGYALANLEKAGVVKAAVFSDERSAGFWAVGAAKAYREPVAIVTTSGTAADELHPALDEAWFQSLPIITLTADRPHELRGVGASQTTHQVGIFGRSVVASDELPAETSYDDGALDRVRGRVRRMVAASRGFLGQAGPVHLNVAFREPLVPVTGAMRVDDKHGQPSLVIQSRVNHPAWDEIVHAGLRTLVVAGDGADRAVVTAAARRGIPIIAEPSSNMTDAETWIPYEQWIVPQLGEYVEQIVVTGRPTLSRPITQLLGRSRIRKIVVATHPEWVDVHETADTVVAGLSDDVGLVDGSWAQDPNRWLDVWRAAATAIDEISGESAGMTDSSIIDHLPASGVRAVSGESMELTALSGDHTSDDLTLLSACRAVWRHSDPALLWLGASNTVRGFDLAANRPGRTDVHSNRGLAGIDGTVASALGLAMACGRPVRAVMGDMTFAYDLSSLAQRPELPGDSSPTTLDIQVIVLDDGGGSIFASLEHRDAEPVVYERFFAAPPHVDPVAAARACGWEARKIETLAELREALVAPITGRSLLHLKIPRPSAQLNAARAAATTAVVETLGESF